MNFQFEITPFPFSSEFDFYLKLKPMYLRKKNGSSLEISMRKIFKKELKNFKIISKCFD